MFISFHDDNSVCGQLVTWCCAKCYCVYHSLSPLYTHAVMVTTLSVASWSPDVVLNVIVFSIPWVLSKKGSSSLGNACWYSDCNNSACGQSHSPVSLAGAVTSIIFVETKVLSWQTRYNTTKLCLSWTNICCDKTFVVTSILLSRQKMCLSWQN